jgi:Lar family restriction alleviation protein
MEFSSRRLNSERSNMTAHEEVQQYLQSITGRSFDPTFLFSLANRLDAAYDALTRALEYDNPPSLSNLIPCPFCGKSVGYITTLHGCRVVCDYCDIYGPAGKNRVEAMLKWNQRAKLMLA